MQTELSYVPLHLHVTFWRFSSSETEGMAYLMSPMNALESPQVVVESVAGAEDICCLHDQAWISS